MQVSIYKSSKKSEMYLYVARPANESEAETFEPLSVLTEAVQAAFGRATFELSESRKLARANVLHVMDSIETRGFFLQMPPEGLIDPNAVAPEGLRGA